MAPATQRRARKTPTTTENRQIATALRRLRTLVERNAEEIEKLRDEQKTQFKRFAQVQAELDTVKTAWEKMQAKE